MPTAAAEAESQQQSAVMARAGVVATFNTDRVASGVKVTVKSAVLEEFFKGLAGDASHETSREMPGKAYRLPNDVDTRDMTMGAWRPVLYSGNQVNLSFLRAVGIGDGEGYTFTAKGLISKEQLDRWVGSAKHAVKALYVQYVKPVEFKVTVTTEERS